MAAFNLSVAYSPYNCGEVRQVRVVIQCAGTVGLDNNIFAYRKINDELLFSHVCSTIDMAEIPVGPCSSEDATLSCDCSDSSSSSTDSYESFKWFRLPYVDLLLRSPVVAKELVSDIEDDVERLYKQMKAHNKLLLLIDHSSLITDEENVQKTSTTKNTAVDICTLASTDVCTIPTASQNRLSIASSKLKYTPLTDCVGVDSVQYVLNSKTIDLFVEIKDGS